MSKSEESAWYHMKLIKVGDRVKATHKRQSDFSEFAVVAVGNDYLESENHYFWDDDWTFEKLEQPWVLPTEPGIYVNETDVEVLGNSIRVWQLTPSAHWVEFDSTKMPGDVLDDIVHQKLNLVRLQAA